MTSQTFDQLARYMKTMRGDLFYTGLPVRKGKSDIWVTEAGKRVSICF